MIKPVIISIFMIVSIHLFSQTKANQPEDVGVSPFELGIYENTSLIKLIANPEKYHGKPIQVIGYLHLEFEGNAVYLHKEDFERSISENSFWVNFSESVSDKVTVKDYSDRYVILIGTFNMNDNGHMGMFGGSIDNIVRLGPWGDTRGAK